MNYKSTQSANGNLEYPTQLPNQSLFSQELDKVKTIHPIFTFLSGGLLKIYQVNLADNRHYVADVGFNHRLYFNKNTTHSEKKFFWKINTPEPLEKVVSIPIAFRLPVSVEIHNFYQNGLNKFDFQYSIIIVVPDQYVVGRLMSLDGEKPLQSIQLAVIDAARGAGAKRDYKQLFIAASEFTELIKDKVRKNKYVMETGLQVKEISCEFLVGDKDLFALIKKIYARYEESKSLSQITETEWRRYLESAVPAIALQERTKRRELIMNAFVALGLPISEREIQSKVDEFSNKIFGSGFGFESDDDPIVDD